MQYSSLLFKNIGVSNVKVVADEPSSLRLTSADFYELTKRTMEFSKSFCGGNVVSILGVDMI